MSDAEIVQRCRRGDDAGFAALMAAHQQYVLRLCWRLCGSREEALDLSQEVFLRLLSSLSTLDPQPSLRPWLRRVATNACLNALERSSRRQQHQQDVATLDRTPGSSADGVASQVEARLAVSKVADELPRLSAAQRMVLTLRVTEGLSYERIADVMRLPVGTVKSHLSRARSQLRSAVFADGGQ